MPDLPIQTILNVGSSGVIIDIECHVSNGLPGITIVGLGNKAVDEAKERIRGAFASSHIPMPQKRVIVNLAPADIPKDSTSLDLPIALSILQASGQLLAPGFSEPTIIIGELGLKGDIRTVRGIIGKLIAGKQRGFEHFVIPSGNMEQAMLVPGIRITSVKNLQEMETILHDQQRASHSTNDVRIPPVITTTGVRLSDVVGQAKAKRGLEIAAAGGHNILLNGPPGTGKSMLAKALPSLLPPLSREEMLEVTHLHSLTNGNYDQLIVGRPFRAPHHSASHVAIVGGGNQLRPGEISLAHRGVLFFDELPEFKRDTLEALRQPLEDKTITVVRAKDSVTYPANFILVATANPCPCGYYGTSKSCSCAAHQILQYRRRLSGPIIDRIDLYVDAERVDHSRLLDNSSNKQEDNLIKDRIARARRRQAKRFNSVVKLNSDMTNNELKVHAKLSHQTQAILSQAADRLVLSARSYMRIVKVARTIADLDNSESIETQHLTEALQYRRPPVEAVE